MNKLGCISLDSLGRMFALLAFTLNANTISGWHLHTISTKSKSKVNPLLYEKSFAEEHECSIETKQRKGNYNDKVEATDDCPLQRQRMN